MIRAPSRLYYCRACCLCLHPGLGNGGDSPPRLMSPRPGSAAIAWPRTETSWGAEGVCGARWLYMIEDNGGGASGFADLALAPSCATCSRVSVTRSRPRSSAPPSRRCSRAGPGRAGRDRDGQDGRLRAAHPPADTHRRRAGRAARPGARADARARDAGLRGDAQLRARMGARVLPVYGGEPIGRQLRAAQARRRRRGGDAGPGARPHQPRHAAARRPEHRRPRRGRRDARHGFRRGHRGDPGQHPGERQTALFSATMPPRINGMVRRHLRDPVRAELGRQASASADGLLVRQTAYLVPRGHKTAALGRRARPGERQRPRSSSAGPGTRWTSSPSP